MNEKDFYKHLSANLKRIRKGKNMTQEQFSILLNIGFYYYQRIEALNTNQTISISLLFKICEALQIDIQDLLQDPNEPQ